VFRPIHLHCDEPAQAREARRREGSECLASSISSRRTKPRLIAFNEYVNDDGTEGRGLSSSIPTRESMAFIWRSLPSGAPPPHMPRRSTRRRASRLFGTPSNAVLELLERQAGAGVPLTVKPVPPRRFHALSCRREAIVGWASVRKDPVPVPSPGLTVLDAAMTQPQPGFRAHRRRRRSASTSDVAVRSRSGAAHVRWLRSAPWVGVVAHRAGRHPPGHSLWAGSPRNCSMSLHGRTFCSAAATRRSRSGSRSSAHNGSASSWSMPCEPVATYRSDSAPSRCSPSAESRLP